MSLQLKVRVDRQGRLVLPARIREELGVVGGGELTLDVNDDEVRLVSHRQAIRRIQKLVRRYVPEGVSLVDELLADRREEAAREDAE
jgi:AbrB family looped-hinge helix DNA binding protein